MTPSRFSAGERPLCYVGNLPVYVTTLLTAIHVLIMVGFAVGGVRLANWALELFAFFPQDVLERGKIWQPATYVFLTLPSFGSAIGLVLFFLFGRQVESFFGPGAFVRLYVFLAVIPAIVLLLVDAVAWHGFGVRFVEGAMAGPSVVHTCVFMAFAFLYPGAVFLFGFLAKWIAAFLAALYTLTFLFARDWPGLLTLWTGIVLTYVLLRKEGLNSRFPALEAKAARLLPSGSAKRARQSRRRLTVVDGEKEKPAEAASGRPRALPRRSVVRRKPAVDTGGIDELLDKISREGLQSLTDEERRRLERASSRLARKERSGP